MVDVSGETGRGLGFGGEAGEVEGEAAEESAGAGGGSGGDAAGMEVGVDEGVDGLTGSEGGEGGEGPMGTGQGSAALDPGGEGGEVFRLELAAWGHGLNAGAAAVDGLEHGGADLGGGEVEGGAEGAVVAGFALGGEDASSFVAGRRRGEGEGGKHEQKPLAHGQNEHIIGP